ncbi:MAG TPA: glutamate--tRNA ligase [SAR86 cluster bacterium]|jgi:glutamyl-tRNA synthetase|nr:glutamate--tRNA ligase [SAR86 cluster bacterium]|tara:strand:- start:1135 stop:2514 length:1380 start_codon:yes stop_codon:yes gene_type:complete
MNDSLVRTRFAPSPTGLLHIGGARTALFAWLYAKTNSGSCLLRIEDTDKERSKQEFTDEIINSFNWMGVNFDEEVVYQSKNHDRHLAVAKELLKSGKAYVCDCSKERLDQLRKEQQEQGLNPKYDGKCRDLSISESENTVIRFKNPEDGSVVFKDLIKGEIEFRNEEMDDFIIVRSDDAPTYNLCVVVDDLDMKISHVIRGDDHINNTPKQINVFKALEVEPPTYGHVPMILGEDGKRMSKRHGAVGVSEYRDMGILPQAFVNYLARLGWSLGDQEIFTSEELVNNFSSGNLNTAPASFSLDKLTWYNKEYLNAMEFTDLLDLISSEHIKNDQYSKDVLELIRERCNSLNDFSTEAQYFYNKPKAFREEDRTKAIKENTLNLLSSLSERLSNLEEWKSDLIQEEIKVFVDEQEIGFAKIGIPLRLSLTGSLNSPSIDKVCELLGKEEVIERIDFALKSF